jgi:plastocyanin
MDTIIVLILIVVGIILFWLLAQPKSSTHLVQSDPTVMIVDFAFQPNTVSIKAGDTVVWTNQGPSQHTVTADNGSFDSSVLSPGQTFSHQFTALGTYSYHCAIHPFMHGQIQVQ